MLKFHMQQVRPVPESLAKYPWEPPLAAARAILAVVNTGGLSGHGEWGSFKAEAVYVGDVDVT